MELKQQQTIISGLYMFLIISTVLSFVPLGVMQMLSLILITIALIIAYFYKFKKDEESLLYNHSVYLIGTIWIGSSVLVFGMLAAALVVFYFGDHTIIDNAMAQITSGGMLDEEALKSVMYDYMDENRTLLIMASIPTIAPSILYFVYRIVNGYGRAIKGYRIAKPSSWL